jgi:hypothetical protein
MRNWSLAIATSALLTLTAAESASAQVVATQSQIDSNGFTTCKTVKQTTTSQSKRVCRSHIIAADWAVA